MRWLRQTPSLAAILLTFDASRVTIEGSTRNDLDRQPVEVISSSDSRGHRLHPSSIPFSEVNAMNVKLLVLAASVVTSSLYGGVVSADIDGCSGTSTCLYDNNDYQGKIAARTHGEGAIKNLSASADNKMDSWANNSNTYKTCAWNGQNGTGDHDGSWNENSSDSNVAPWNSDVISSWRTKYGC